QLAILSSIGQRRGEFLTAVLSEAAARKTDHVRALLNIVASQIGAAGVKQDLALFVRQIDELAAANEKLLAEGLVRNLVGGQPAGGNWPSGGGGGKVAEIRGAIYRDAERTAGDDKQPPAARGAAVRTLATADFSEYKQLFPELLQSRQPQPVQTAAL